MIGWKTRLSSLFGDGRAQAVLDQQPEARAFVEALVEEPRTTAACVLGRIKRKIGAAHQIERIDAFPALAHHDADRSADLHRVAENLARLGAGVDERVARGQRARGVALGQNDAELIPAHACGDGAHRQQLVDAAPDRADQIVAGGVAEIVVHGLEAVEIEDGHRERSGFGVNLVGEIAEERGPVRRPSQSVVERRVAHARFAGGQLLVGLLQQRDLVGKLGVRGLERALGLPFLRQRPRELEDFLDFEGLSQIVKLVHRARDSGHIHRAAVGIPRHHDDMDVGIERANAPRGLFAVDAGGMRMSRKTTWNGDPSATLCAIAAAAASPCST